MGRNKIGLQFNGWDEYMAKLDKVGGSSAMKRGVEAGLLTSKAYVNQLISKATTTPNLPAGGKYGSGADLREAISRQMHVFWSGMEAEVRVGFNDYDPDVFLVSIFLMYGTPRMKPAKGLKEAIYGSKTNKEVSKIQQEAVNKVINRIMEG